MIQINDVLTFKNENNVDTMTPNLWNMFFLNGRTTKCELRFLGSYEKIMNAWKNQPCYIIAGGRSMQGFDYSKLDGKNSICINHMIEFYDRSPWHIALDQKFYNETTYDMSKYQGVTFTQNINKTNAPNVMYFVRRLDTMCYHLKDGLFKGNLSGLVAVNLAIMAGANPIYLLGMDCGGFPSKIAHPDGYTGELGNAQRYEFTAVEFDNFAGWKKRIFNLSKYSLIDTFEKMSFEESEVHVKKYITSDDLKEPVIFHMSNQGDIANMTTIPRFIFKKCYGRHFLFRFTDKLPEDLKPDLYILHHFIGTDKQVQEFKHKEKAIVIVHSMNCFPRGNFKKIISLTNTWKEILNKNKINKNVEVVRGGINIGAYKEKAKFENKTIGRITRWTLGKINPGWNKFILDIFKNEPDTKCIIYTQKTGNPVPLEYKNIEYVQDIKLYDRKDIPLSKLSVYVHANNYFKETFSHGIIEAMATGLPIVLLREDTLVEVVGDAAIICDNMEEVTEKTLILLRDKELWKEYSEKSLERAKFYRWQNMCSQFDKVIKDCINEQ